MGSPGVWPPWPSWSADPSMTGSESHCISGSLEVCGSPQTASHANICPCCCVCAVAMSSASNRSSGSSDRSRTSSDISTAWPWCTCMSRAKPTSALDSLGIAVVVAAVMRPTRAPATSATSTSRAAITISRVRLWAGAGGAADVAAVTFDVVFTVRRSCRGHPALGCTGHRARGRRATGGTSR